MAKELKITKVGNSAAVLLPRDVLVHLRVSIGDKLFLGEMPEGYRVTATDQDFVAAMTAAEEVMREDRDVLAVLAK
jgi:putative addiction module antidote